MTTLELSEQTKAMLDESLIEGANAEQKIRALLRAEYIRKLGQHQRTNAALEQKYGLGLAEFVAQRVAEKRGFTWEIAFSGIETLERRLVEWASHGDLKQ